MKFDVQISGLDTIRKALEQRPKAIFKEVELEFEATADQITSKQKQRVPKDMGGSGGLASAISNARTKPLTYELVAQRFHAAYMEFGTKKRARIPAELAGIASEFQAKKGGGSGEGFYDSILEWVKRKGITGTYSLKTRKRTGNKLDQQIEDEQAAFAIYLSIKRHGVKPHPFFFAAYFEERPKLIERIKNILVA